jgi:hypothetical protein
MTRKRVAYSAVILGIVLGFALPRSQATPTLYSPETWNSGLNTWQQLGDATLSDPGTYMNAMFNIPAVPGTSRIFVDGSGSPSAPSSTFAGNQNYLPYYQDLGVIFSVKYDQAPPAGLVMYFKSDTSGREWGRYIDVSGMTSPGAWYTFGAVQFTWDPLLWAPLLGGVGVQADFLNDLADVDRFGFYVSMNPAPGDQNIGFDNTMFIIPEPDTIFLLAMVLLAMGVTFRGRIATLWTKMTGGVSRN